MRKFILLITILQLINPLWSQQKPTSGYILPLKIPISLSGNFGEVRLNHFHSGIDIRTQGKTGFEVTAVQDGYISRIKVEGDGYGKTVYINHAGGYTSVYAHLSKFSNKIEAIVKKNQYNNKSFAVDIYLKPEDITVLKGQVIAFSGNSGRSGGPHLHFEIRETELQKPINFISFPFFKYSDTNKPEIKSLWVYPMDSSFVNFKNKKQRFNLVNNGNNYSLKQNDTLLTNGRFGFGIETFDIIGGESKKYGITKIQVFVDSIQRFCYTMDGFLFTETRYVNSLLDYEEKMINNTTIIKTFIDPNNKLSLYEGTIKRGLLEFNDNSSHSIKIIVSDAHKNKSSLVFKVKNTTNYRMTTDYNPLDTIIRWNEDFTFTEDSINVFIPKNSLYTDVPFKYQVFPRQKNTFSSVYLINTFSIPVHREYSLTIKGDTSLYKYSNKVVVVNIDNQGKIASMGGLWQNGACTIKTRLFGMYSLSIDTCAPKIKLLNAPTANNYETRNRIEFKITDDLSGIYSYKGIIDGEWVLFEYDPKNELLYYELDTTRLSKNIKHNLELFVTDERSNGTMFALSFLK